MEFLNTVKGFIIQRVSSRPDVVCVQCHGSQVIYQTKTKDGFELFFCSQQCGHDYWGEYHRKSALEQRPRTCCYPGCTKPCYQEGAKVHDYCGEYHRKSALEQRPRICRYPGCTKPCYQEGTKVHDYCGRTHATEHQAMKGGGYHRQHSGNSQTYSSGSRHFPQCSTTGPIRFYNRGEPYYEFTNFYEAVVRIDNDDWLTTEHYFQAQKFVGTPLVGTIQMLERPREAFEKSRDPRYSKWRRSDWESVKEDVMYKALQAKFTQHEKLRRKLLETGDRELIEHSPHDSYWGDGGNGMGKNRLGELLMKLRREMKDKQPVQPPQPSSHSVHHEPPKQQVTMGNSSGSNEPNKQPAGELDQHDKDAAGQSTQRSPPPRPRDPQCNTDSSNAVVIANKGAGAQLPTPSSTPTDSRTPQPDPVPYLNQSGSHQSKNDPSCSNITSQHSAPDNLMGTYQIGGRGTTSSAPQLTREPLRSKPLDFPEHVLSRPATYADALRRQPLNNLGEGGQPLGLQSQPTNVPPSVGTPTSHAQSSHPQNNPNNLGEGGPQPQPKNNPEDEPMDTNEY